MKTEYLLSVDLGIKTGLALFDREGNLLWCRSHNLGNITRLKRAVHNILNDLPCLSLIVIEGGGPIAEIWKKEAMKRALKIIEVTAEEWRAEFFTHKARKDSKAAKASAIELAQGVIKNTPSAYKKGLNHNTAEAVLIGYWAFRVLIEPLKDEPAEYFCGIFRKVPSLTKALLKERKEEKRRER